VAEEAPVSDAEENNKALVRRFVEEVYKRGNLDSLIIPMGGGLLHGGSWPIGPRGWAFCVRAGLLRELLLSRVLGSSA
jgi:hypothetical protein